MRFFSALNGSLRLLPDSLLSRSIRFLRDAVETMQQDGTAKENSGHFKKVQRALTVAEAEVGRRGLDLPEEAKS